MSYAAVVPDTGYAQKLQEDLSQFPRMHQNAAKRMGDISRQTPSIEVRAPRGLKISTNPSVLLPIPSSPISSASYSQLDTDSAAKSSSRRTTPPPDDTQSKGVCETFKQQNDGVLDLGNSVLLAMGTAF